MIDVDMRKDDGVELFRFAAESFIFRARFGSSALKQAAVEQNPQILSFDQMLTAGHFSGSTEKCQFHKDL